MNYIDFQTRHNRLTRPYKEHNKATLATMLLSAVIIFVSMVLLGQTLGFDINLTNLTSMN